jgi:hypothetical protein
MCSQIKTGTHQNWHQAESVANRRQQHPTNPNRPLDVVILIRARGMSVNGSEEKLVLDLVAASEADVVWAVPTDEIVFARHATAAVAPPIVFVPKANG